MRNDLNLAQENALEVWHSCLLGQPFTHWKQLALDFVFSGKKNPICA
jgi:hypothetical protein